MASRQLAVLTLLAIGTVDLMWINRVLVPAALADSSASATAASHEALAPADSATDPRLARASQADADEQAPAPEPILPRQDSEPEPKPEATEALVIDEAEPVHDDEPMVDAGSADADELVVVNVDEVDSPSHIADEPSPRDTNVDDSPSATDTEAFDEPEVADQPTVVHRELEPRDVTHIYFRDTGSTILSAAGRDKLDIVLDTLREDRSLRVTVRGHTDHRGSESINLVLSTRRAQAAAAYLTSEGIDRSRITVEGVGSTQPLAAGSTADALRVNRRVDIFYRKDD